MTEYETYNIEEINIKEYESVFFEAILEDMIVSAKEWGMTEELSMVESMRNDLINKTYDEARYIAISNACGYHLKFMNEQQRKSLPEGLTDGSESGN